MVSLLKITLKIAAVAAVAIVLLNLNFFWQNARHSIFYVEPQTSTVSDKPITNPADTLIIDSLGIKAPIVYAEKNTEQVFQEALKKGVVHYPGTAKPGNLGNCYIFGHSSDYAWSKGDYKTVFALLPRIEKGAKIIATDQAGNSFTYTVTESFVASPKDVYLLDQQDFRKRLLTLQTSYPLGTALKRYIVRAEMQ